MGKTTFKIKITGYPNGWDGGGIGSPQSEEAKKKQLSIILKRLCYMRSAEKIGDIETVNLTQLGKLKDQQIQFEKIDEQMITKFEDFMDFIIVESSEFNQYLMGGEVQTPFGPGYGFAQDPSLSIYSDDNRPYVDQYARSAGTSNKLMQMSQKMAKDLFNDPRFNKRSDIFLEDSVNYKNMKILRMVQNESLKLDVYLSFEFNEEEFFGAFKNFNGLNKPPALTCPELLNESRYPYIDREYFLKLNNYLYKKLVKWFKPESALYINLKDNNPVRDEMGRQFFLKEGKIVEVLGHNEDQNNDPFIVLKIKDKTYYIEKNNYYWFKWRFKPANEKKKEE
jgi:catabolite regulation protein CreA